VVDGADRLRQGQIVTAVAAHQRAQQTVQGVAGQGAPSANSGGNADKRNKQ